MRLLAVFAIFTLLISCANSGPTVVNTSPKKTNLKGKDRLMFLPELTQKLKKAREEGRTLWGYGKTVFSGTKVEKFDCELVDIMDNFMPQRPIIIIKCHHPVTDTANIIAGMSGSPIYFEDRMVGALAYSFNSFPVEPIAGVTPIEFMISDGLDKNALPSTSMLTKSETLVPIATPLFVSGLSPRALKEFEEEVKPLGFVVAPGGSGSKVIMPPSGMEEGGVIGGVIATGDIDLAGIGTVTYMDGDFVLGFGHPFFGDGKTEIPMSNGVVNFISSSRARSFKMATAGKITGCLFADKSTCIAGKLGMKSNMVPLTVTVTNEGTGMKKTVNVYSMNHKRWLPLVARYTLSSTIDAFDPTSHDRTTLSRMTIEFEDGRDVSFEQVQIYSEHGFAYAGDDTLYKLSSIMNNPFEPAKIKKVNIETKFVDELKAARIKGAWPLTKEVERGGTARIRLVLKRQFQPDEIMDVSVPISKEVAPGRELSIRVGGGASMSEENPPATTLDELIESLKIYNRADWLISEYDLDTFTVLYKGKMLENIPPTVIAQMSQATLENALVMKARKRHVQELDRVIVGSGSVTVRVK